MRGAGQVDCECGVGLRGKVILLGEGRGGITVLCDMLFSDTVTSSSFILFSFPFGFASYCYLSFLKRMKGS